MFGTESEIDANFFRLIHQLAGPEIIARERERRGSSRQPFLASQRIAPVEGSEFPAASAFFTVRCHNLTGAGFSFFAAAKPDFTSLVAAFGCAGDVIYIGAEVLHCADVLVHSSGLVERVESRARHVSYRSPNGESVTPMVLVGCRFTRRLKKPAAAGGD